MKPFLFVIYGKDNCSKCAKLKQEVGMLLNDETMSADFDMDYQNLSTASGMAAYAMSETVNGQRIPALQIMKYDNAKKSYVKIPDPREESYGLGFVPVYLQLQTNYGNSIADISIKNVAELAEIARSL